jgi:hypothetical protein
MLTLMKASLLLCSAILLGCGSKQEFILNEVSTGSTTSRILPEFFRVSQGDTPSTVLHKLRQHSSEYDTVLQRTNKIIVLRPLIAGRRDWELSYHFANDTLIRMFFSTALPKAWTETRQLYFDLKHELVARLGSPTFDTAIVTSIDSMRFGYLNRWGNLHTVWKSADTIYSELHTGSGLLYFGVRRY